MWAWRSMILGDRALLHLVWSIWRGADRAASGGAAVACGGVVDRIYAQPLTVKALQTKLYASAVKCCINITPTANANLPKQCRLYIPLVEQWFLVHYCVY